MFLFMPCVWKERFLTSTLACGRYVWLRLEVIVKYTTTPEYVMARFISVVSLNSSSELSNRLLEFDPRI